MRERAGDGRFTRRDLLKGLGLTAGALALASPLWAYAAEESGDPAAPPRGAPLKVGVLLPASAAYPRLGESLLTGLRLSFDRSGREVSLVAVDAGTGQGSARRASDAMLEGEKPDLAVGLVSPTLAATIGEGFRSRGVPFVGLDAGANVPLPGGPGGYSLSLWRSSWAMGGWAAENMGRRAALATSFYDSGYDALYAFRLGFEEAGGRVLGTQVTHLPHEPGDGLGPALDAIEGARPDFVYASYCGESAVEFVRAYAGLDVPLAGSGFLTDEGVLGEQGESALGIKTCLPWAPGLSPFDDEYRSATGREPDAFAALGSEAARGILAALDAGDDPAGSSASAFGSLHVREARRSDGPGVANATVDDLGPVAPSGAQLAKLRSGLQTGWLNTYMVA